MCSTKQTDSYSLKSNDALKKIKSQLDSKLEVLQLQLNESDTKLYKQLDDEYYLKYIKLENRVCNLVGNKMLAVSKQKQLQITVDYLLENNQSSAKKYEMLKTFVDWIADTKIKANKRQKNKITCFIAESSRPGSAEITTSDDDIYKEQKILKHIIQLLAEKSVSLEKFCHLEILVDTLAGSSVSASYIDSALRDQAKERVKDLQKISTAITNIDHNNFTLEKRNIELQAFVKELKKSNNRNVDQMEKEINKQQMLIKAVQDEKNTYKMRLEQMLTEANENLNKNITQLIHKFLDEQMS